MITVVIKGGVCQDVIGARQHALIDYDNLKDEGHTRDEIDKMVEEAEELIKAGKKALKADLLKFTQLSHSQVHKIIEHCDSLTIGGVIDACIVLEISFTKSGMSNMFAHKIVNQRG